MKVLDLFCGAGGLASGFSKAGFRVHGVDVHPDAKKVFEGNKFGPVTLADLSEKTVFGHYDLVIGGPPCKPWSQINVVRRGEEHADYALLGRFFDHIQWSGARHFLLENVVPARKEVARHSESMRQAGYSVSIRVVKYSDYGAATSRRRLIAMGSKDIEAEDFFTLLEEYRAPARTVREAIGGLEEVEGEIPDHEYPHFQTIHKYKKYYETGKYGWYALTWDEPAPSFGNIVKTYTLHPSSWNGSEPRVISIREALLLMGFDEAFVFPPGMGRGRRYQMVSDAVSPVFSYAAARTLKRLIWSGQA